MGRLDWSLQRDKDGHRDYSIQWLVQTLKEDGPQVAASCPGLPAIGAQWSFGNDLDPWAFCWPTLTIKPVLTKEPNRHWLIEQLFTTKPLKRCQDASIENPLDEPPRVSGSFIKFTKIDHKDRHGKIIKSSSHELFTGQQVEWNDNRPTVAIGLTMLSLPLAEYTAAVDTVNDANLWGLGPRKILLANVKWQRLLYGLCNFYYTVDYEFEINFKTFDRKIPDLGTKVLAPGGDKDNPKDFVAYRNPSDGELGKAFLDGNGNAIADGADIVEIDFEKYEESNFLDLDVPTSL